MAADPDSRIKDVLDDILTLVTAMDTRVDTLESLIYQDAYSRLVTGQGTMPRTEAISTVTYASGTVRLSHFTAIKSETSTQVTTVSGSTAAAATPTLCRVGLYSIAANGDGTLVASIANDTTLWATINTAYTRSWSVPYAMVAGQRYAIAAMVVSAAATPTMLGSSGLNLPSVYAAAPRMCGLIPAQADLPASFLDSGLTATTTRLYATILP